MPETRKRRVERMWQDVDRFGWPLPQAMVRHFGKFPELLGPEWRYHRFAGNDFDACLPDPGTWEYEVFDTFVKAAEKVSERLASSIRKPTILDVRGFSVSRHRDGTLKANWERPFEWGGFRGLESPGWPEFLKGLRKELSAWERSL